MRPTNTRGSCTYMLGIEAIDSAAPLIMGSLHARLSLIVTCESSEMLYEVVQLFA